MSEVEWPSADDTELVRKVTVAEAVDHFLPIEGIEPRAYRYFDRRKDLQEKLEQASSTKEGSIWLYRSKAWNPEGLIGSEGLVFLHLDDHAETLFAVDY